MKQIMLVLSLFGLGLLLAFAGWLLVHEVWAMSLGAGIAALVSRPVFKKVRALNRAADANRRL